MAKWIYELKAGADLREAIDNENREDILDRLMDAWIEIHEQFPEYYDDDDLDQDLDDIEMQREDVEEEDIDYLLSNLYDYCDAMRIWIKF